MDSTIGVYQGKECKKRHPRRKSKLTKHSRSVACLETESGESEMLIFRVGEVAQQLKAFALEA